MPPIKEIEAAIKSEAPLVIIKGLLREVQLFLFTVKPHERKQLEKSRES